MKVDRASADIKAGLVVFEGGQHKGGQHNWVFSEPDEDRLRQVYFNGNEEGKGILLGSVMLISMGYITQSPDIEVGRCLGVKFPDRPTSDCVLISTLVTAIIIMA